LIQRALASPRILPAGIHRIIRVEIRYVKSILSTFRLKLRPKRPTVSDLTKISGQSMRDPGGIHISCKIWTAETVYLRRHLTTHFYVDEVNNVVTHATYVVHEDR
jgi:hypothetical protein